MSLVFAAYIHKILWEVEELFIISVNVLLDIMILVIYLSCIRIIGTSPLTGICNGVMYLLSTSIKQIGFALKGLCLNFNSCVTVEH
jgi:hypothetical protein